MPSRLDFAQFNTLLEPHAREGRDVQLFGPFGQTLFPIYHPVSGGLTTDVAVFPILRGQGEKAPPFSGSFPTKDGETRDLGDGWIVMCVLFHYDQTTMGKITKLERAEDKLRAMKSGTQGEHHAA